MASKKIKSIMPYESAGAIFSDYFPETKVNLSSDLGMALDHMDDFEESRYIVLNEETVIVYSKFDGDVFAQMPLDEFREMTLEYIQEE